ncbi:hypothetical protein ST47_g6329 [Ascochyta rabiei]|uniref:Uncharacterized protein n=1 Tax=Didymella rabiei TaxID=5454 RepID=A0A163CLP3_DIDRA|nr:hypothetical protein ST47_g6329 [Ascochyta rabiei]
MSTPHKPVLSEKRNALSYGPAALLTIRNSFTAPSMGAGVKRTACQNVDRYYRFGLRKKLRGYRSQQSSDTDLAYRIQSITNSYGWTDDRPMLDIYLCNRQACLEVHPLLYEKTFSYFESVMRQQQSVMAAKRFLASRPHSCSLIRRLGVYAEEEAYSGQSALSSITPEDFKTSIEYIASHCQLRYLKIRVYNWHLNEVADFRTGMAMFGKSKEIGDVSEWVKCLSVWNDLEALDVQLRCCSVPLVQRSFAMLKFMRSNMVQEGHTLQGMEGIRMQIAHPDVDQGPTHERELMCEISIEKGRPMLLQERRVKLLPDSWCKQRGIFLARWKCDCSPGSDWDHRFSCGNDHLEHLVRIPESDWEGRGTLAKGSPKPCVAFEKSELDYLYGQDVWDSRRWGGGPFQDYLPQGVSVGDFQRAKSLLEAGVRTWLPAEHERYPGSEFGDTDSPLSIHWDDGDDLDAVTVKD